MEIFTKIIIFFFVVLASTNVSAKLFDSLLAGFFLLLVIFSYTVLWHHILSTLLMNSFEHINTFE